MKGENDVCWDLNLWVGRLNGENILKYRVKIKSDWNYERKDKRFEDRFKRFSI